MPYVGFTGVANQANTTDGFASGVGAQNPPALVNQFGLYVGDGGVVDLYDNGAETIKFYIADETSPGYVLQEDSSKIVLEVS
jgi:hypothetical protein